MPSPEKTDLISKFTWLLTPDEQKVVALTKNLNDADTLAGQFATTKETYHWSIVPEKESVGMQETITIYRCVIDRNLVNINNFNYKDFLEKYKAAHLPSGKECYDSISSSKNNGKTNSPVKIEYVSGEQNSDIEKFNKRLFSAAVFILFSGILESGRNKLFHKHRIANDTFSIEELHNLFAATAQNGFRGFTFNFSHAEEEKMRALKGSWKGFYGPAEQQFFFDC